MPKMKSNRSAKKRFKTTGTGKFMKRQAFRHHKLEHKPSTRTRRLKGEAEITGKFRKQVSHLLGLS
jgi:large subunit ribosomal protein L35